MTKRTYIMRDGQLVEKHKPIPMGEFEAMKADPLAFMDYVLPNVTLEEWQRHAMRNMTGQGPRKENGAGISSS